MKSTRREWLDVKKIEQKTTRVAYFNLHKMLKLIFQLNVIVRNRLDERTKVVLHRPQRSLIDYTDGRAKLQPRVFSSALSEQAFVCTLEGFITVFSWCHREEVWKASHVGRKCIILSLAVKFVPAGLTKCGTKQLDVNCA